MGKRINYAKASPGVFRAMTDMNRTVVDSSLERSLLTLVSILVSQLNGCDFCVALHMREALTCEEPSERMQDLSYWGDSVSLGAHEQATLTWTESITLIAETHAPYKVYQQATLHFSEKVLGDLTLAIAMIDAWNRFGVGSGHPFHDLFKMEPESSAHVN
jgi:AhpD family alkylhydroperoxidase